MEPPARDAAQRFTGKERDAETGLDYFGARYYGSKIGRFTTTDPHLDRQANLINPQKWNRYAYGLNNPLRYVDPDGRVERTTYDARVLAQQRAANGYQHGPSGTAETVLMYAFGALAVAPVAALAVEVAPALFVAAQIAGSGYLATRAEQIHAAVGGTVTRDKTTVAIGQVGAGQTLVASSEKVLRPAQRALLTAGEAAVKGPGHAEVTVINAARAAGQTVTEVLASRPICANCATAIRDAGAKIGSVLKEQNRLAFDANTLKDELRRLPHPHRVAFGASCSQRLIPNYEKFSSIEGWGDPEVLKMALDEVWRSLEGERLSAARIATLAKQCDAAAPDTERFESLYTSAALDAASAIAEALRCCESGEPEHAVNASTSARDSVDMHIQMRNDLDPMGDALEDAIQADPLMQRELQKQKQDLTALKQTKDLTPAFLGALRASSSYDLLS